MWKTTRFRYRCTTRILFCVNRTDRGIKLQHRSDKGPVLLASGRVINCYMSIVRWCRAVR